MNTHTSTTDCPYLPFLQTFHLVADPTAQQDAAPATIDALYQHMRGAFGAFIFDKAMQPNRWHYFDGAISAGLSHALSAMDETENTNKVLWLSAQFNGIGNTGEDHFLSLLFGAPSGQIEARYRAFKAGQKTGDRTLLITPDLGKGVHGASAELWRELMGAQMPQISDTLKAMQEAAIALKPLGQNRPRVS